MTNYVVADTKLFLEVSRSGRSQLDLRDHVVTIFVVLYRIGQAALAPRNILSDFSAEVTDDAVNAIGNGSNLVFGDGGSHDVHEFVFACVHITHTSFPRDCSARSRLCQG